MKHWVKWALLLCLPLCPLGNIQAQSTHSVFFKGSDYELNIYRIKGQEPGKTLLLIGGIQGDEPGGYLSADLYSDIALQKGSLIIVPRANLKSIILGQRGADGDMNRQFHDKASPGPMRKVVDKLKGLMAEADVFLHLHDGWGFHRPTYIDKLRNPSRYGQSLIVDTDIFTCDSGEQLKLGEIGQEILRKVNARINDQDHHLHYFNTRTNDPKTRHTAMRKTATYYALRRHCLPAYGVEASKNLPSLELKVLYHNLVINEFMNYLDIVPLTPKVLVEAPNFEFAEIEINGKKTIAHDGDTISIKKGDQLTINKIAANSPRGISADLIGYGDLNDLGQQFTLHKNCHLIFRKEGQTIGKVYLNMDKSKLPYVAGAMRIFIVEINHERRLVMQGDTLNLSPSDQIVIRSSFSDGSNSQSPEINFKGWVPHGVRNKGDDRNYTIKLNDRLQKKFSVGGNGLIYPIVAERNNKKLGEIFVRIAPQ
jgi:hypothetical protein